MDFITYFDQNYMNKGLVCHKTIMQWSPDSTLYILCLDDIVYNKVKTLKNVVPIKQSEIEEHFPQLLTIKGTRLAKEYYATQTPFLPLYVFDKFGPEVITYTDADMAFFSEPEEILDVFGDHSIMACDHGFNPPRSGVRFNVGILCYRNDEKCRKFLNWWGDKCLKYCKWETKSDGSCADQGWLGILHYEGEKYNFISCPHEGINYAPWKLPTHSSSKNGDKILIDNKYTLICYHYHEFKLTLGGYFPTGWKTSKNDLELIYEPYYKMIKKVGIK